MAEFFPFCFNLSALSFKLSSPVSSHKNIQNHSRQSEHGYQDDVGEIIDGDGLGTISAFNDHSGGLLENENLAFILTQPTRQSQADPAGDRCDRDRPAGDGITLHPVML